MTTHHPSLSRGPADLIAGRWIALNTSDATSASAVSSINPAHPDRTVWSAIPVQAHIDDAVVAAREALPRWIRAGRDKRISVLRRFQAICKARQAALAELICDETGKAMWEARAEASLLGSKVDITLESPVVDARPNPAAAMARVSDFDFKLTDTRTARAYFRPHGVMGVLGPFNFPAHLPNGHIVPALAMGNTVVFKPSDKTPAVGQLLAEFFQQALDEEGFAGLGIVNLVHGAVPAAKTLVAHDDLDGILFTGSWPVGRAIMQANLSRPGRILALEMGGNNAAVVMPDADLRQAAIEIARCAFNTTGQRCTSTRRAIIHKDVADRLIPAICKAATNIIVGDPRSSTPVFMGPIIRETARRAAFDFQFALAKAGGDVLVESTPLTTGAAAASDGFYLTPSVVRVDRFTLTPGPSTHGSPGEGVVHQHITDPGCDEELFGPLLRISVTDGLDDAIEQANATRYGLVASIFTKDAAAAERFLFDARAGCVNVNTGTAGASSRLPFGGLGLSGNHRPAGSFSLDYCAFPTAAMLESGPAATLAEGMRFEDTWIR
jgi:succinylglutamic semialdehyde dehydrogenase